MKFERWLAAGLCVLAGACGSDDKTTSEADNTCAPSVSYETVGEPFLEKHCQRCHGGGAGGTLGGGHVFDSEAALAEHGHDAYASVASGDMPADGAAVPTGEKEAFLAWLDCSGLAATSEAHSHD